MAYNLLDIVQTVGYAGVLLVILLETGFFFGFFLPGDSLLFTVGFLAAQHVFNIWSIILGMLLTAIIGYQLAYWFGKHLSRWLLRCRESFWFRRSYLETARDFYRKHGSHALVLGRLLPMVRTFSPIVAGMIAMSRPRYFLLNVLGALLWIGGVTLAGFILGHSVPNADKYILPVVLTIIMVSLFPALWRYIRRS